MNITKQFKISLTMKVNCTLLFFLAFTALSIGQNNTFQNYYINTSYLKLGNSSYMNNLEGIGYLMNDLKISEEELFNSMAPHYNRLKKRNSDATKILYFGTGASMAILIGASMHSFSEVENFSSNLGPSLALAGLSGLVAIVTGVAFVQKRVSHQDILNFKNAFNKISTKDKIELTVNPSFNLGSNFSGGLAFTLSF